MTDHKKSLYTLQADPEKSRDFIFQNPGIFRDLLIECKGTYGPLGPSATALVGQNIITVRSHLKKHSGMQLMWIQAGDLRRIVIGVVNA